MRKPILLLLWLLLPFWASAQFYTTGSEPARTQWRQMQAGPYTLVYPQDMDSLARRYAWLFEQTSTRILQPLDARTVRMPVVLHPYNMFSNGMVSWAPRRMELYTSPPAFSYAQNWEKQLVLHETRHVAQMSKLEENVFKILSYVGGQQIQGLAAGIYTPRWLLEGDAVVSETELSFAGRGREAAFLMPYKAYLLDSISFSWDTWRFGSHRYYTPHHYQLGYLFLSAFRYKQGNQTLSEVYDLISRRPYMSFITALVFKQTSGSTVLGHWNKAIDAYRQEWQQQLEVGGPVSPHTALLPATPPHPLHKPWMQKSILASSDESWRRPSANYVSYASPIPVPDSTQTLYALRSDLDRGSVLVQIDSMQREQVLRYTGSLSSQLALGGHKLYWTELVAHPRWEQLSYSELRAYDIEKQEFEKLSHKARYHHPSVSPNTERLAVAHQDILGHSALHVISAGEGRLIQSYPAPAQGRVQQSVWASNSLIYALALNDSGLGIYALNLHSGLWSVVLPPQYGNIGNLSYAQGWLYFDSDWEGSQHIYALNPLAPRPYKIIHARYGAFSPQIVDSTLYYANYTALGLKPVKTQSAHWRWQAYNPEQNHETPFAREISSQSRFRIDSITVPSQPDFPSQPYNRAANLFRLHSWAPFYYSLDNISILSMEDVFHTVSPGLNLFSQNTLSTAVTQLGYAIQNGLHAAHFKFSYSGWYPVIELSADANDRKAEEFGVISVQGSGPKAYQLVRGNASLRGSLNVYIPFNLSSGGWIRGFIPRTQFTLRNDLYADAMNQLRPYGSLQAGMQYYQYRPMAANNIYPRWGFGLSFQTLSSPGNKAFGSEASALIYAYAPGFLPNHGLRLRAHLQQQWLGRYYHSNLSPFPRGYQNIASESYMGLSADYAFPIWLDDFNLGPFLYLKRMRIIPFSDWGYNKNHLGHQILFSAGSDALLDFHAFRLNTLFSAGLRTAFTANGHVAWSFLFNIAIP